MSDNEDIYSNTPTTDEIRETYSYLVAHADERFSVEQAEAEFDRWLATVRAEARSQALDEAAGVLRSQRNLEYRRESEGIVCAQVVAGSLNTLAKVLSDRAGIDRRRAATIVAAGTDGAS